MSNELSSEVQKKFSALINEKKFHELKLMLEKNENTPSEYIVQTGYRAYLDEDTPERIKLFYFLKLFDITNTAPENAILNRICDIALRMDSLTMLEMLVKRLNLGHQHFKNIIDVVNKSYNNFLRWGQFNQISKLMTITGITPSEDIIQDAYRIYLLEGRFISVMGLREKTGYEPGKKIITEVMKQYYSNFSLTRQLNHTDLKSQKKINEECKTWLEWIEELSKIGHVQLCFRCGCQNREDAKSCNGCKSSFKSEPALARPENVLNKQTMVIEKPVIGRTILKGHFLIKSLLGRGGMGEIYLAEDTRLQRKVAIKTILSEYIKDRNARARFLSEASIASQMDHPAICTIYEVIEEDGSDYIIMQYVDGQTLDTYTRENKLDVKSILDLALQISDGISAAHDRGILHRDLKPGNIMIDRNKRAKILDFGLAKMIEPLAQPKTSSTTQVGVIVGTPAYMSPEQILGLEVDARSDIFSFGVTLYEMISQKNPFTASEPGATLFNVLHQQIDFNDKFPPELATLLQRALQKDRNARFKNFAELQTSLKTLIQKLTK